MRPSTSRSGRLSLAPESLYRALDTRCTAVVYATVFYVIHILCEGKIAISQVSAGFAFVFIAAALAAREIPLTLHVLCFPLALYGAASTVSAVLSSRQIHAPGEVMLWIKMATFPTALILYRVAPPLRRIAVYAFGILTTGIAVWGMLQYFSVAYRDLDNRIKGPGTHVMTYSGLLLPLSLLFLILWFHSRRSWYLVPALTGTFALLLTFTRSAWLAWGVAIFFVAVATRPRRLVYALPAALLVVTFLPLSMFGRLASSFDIRQESNRDRLRMLEAGVEIIRDYPLLGVGPANVKPIYPLYRLDDAPRFRTPHLHNNPMQIWAERGIVALVAYLLLLVLFARECLRAKGKGRPWGEGGIAFMVALTFAGLFEFNFGDTEVFYLTLDLMALVIAQIEASGADGAVSAPA